MDIEKMTDEELQANKEKLQVFISQNPYCSTLEKEVLEEVKQEIQKRELCGEINY